MSGCRPTAFGKSVVRFDGTTGAFMDAFVTPGSGGLNGPKQMLFVPEPASIELLAVSLAGVFAWRRGGGRGRSGKDS
jgi:hypothetical protein